MSQLRPKACEGVRKGRRTNSGKARRNTRSPERQTLADTSMHETSAVTTGGDVDVATPGDEAERAERSGRADGLVGWATAVPSRLRRTIRAHWQFSLVLLAAALLRLVIIVAYPPIMWFNDSFNYFYDAVTHIPDTIRPNGYPFFLSVFLLPLHSVYPIAVVQAGLGLTMGVLIYALLRRRGLPWWGAALPALPVLFDVFEMQLEHMITADTLFTFLVTLAVVICCWKDRPSIVAMVFAGLLIGYASVVRSVGEPLLLVVLVGMLLRRIGWRPLIALAIAGLVPIAAYAGWFHHTTGKYALTESGTFLYGRVMTFAECGKMDPPADLRPLCDWTPTYQRPPSQEYVWADHEKWPAYRTETPLYRLYGASTAVRFTPYVAGLTQKFAVLAIRKQPMDYFRAVYADVAHTFSWDRQPDPKDLIGNGNGPEFRFSDDVYPVPWWAQHAGQDVSANTLSTALHKYLGGSIGQPRVIHPWAGFVQWYQRTFSFRGSLLGLTVLIGAFGFLARWRRLGGISLLPWLVGALLILLPPMTAGFSYRYVVPAVPVACLAAGLAFTRQAGEGSLRAAVADLGRYFGRGVTVKQE
jgi:hypothetical protein